MCHFRLQTSTCTNFDLLKLRWFLLQALYTVAIFCSGKWCLLWTLLTEVFKTSWEVNLKQSNALLFPVHKVSPALSSQDLMLCSGWGPVTDASFSPTFILCSFDQCQQFDPLACLYRNESVKWFIVAVNSACSCWIMMALYMFRDQIWRWGLLWKDGICSRFLGKRLLLQSSEVGDALISDAMKQMMLDSSCAK